ncbi:MAG: alpha/beta hydrolase [Candidatus Hydrogenedentes bacterium]|nr:alpha/beta hydrolase [Candidatus Hydrogenedentota bacterium]
MDYPHLQSVELLHHPAASLRLRPHTKNNYSHIRNIVYAEANGVGLVMDIFQPTGSSSNLGVLDIVSGGWHSDRTMLNEHIGFGLIDALCEQGLTVFAVSPGSLTLYTGLEMIEHVHAAIRHIKGYADQYTIDPEHLGIIGVSAGGHLAAQATLTVQKAHPYPRDPWQQQDTHVKATALFFPPSDLLDYNGMPITRFKLEGIDLTRLLFHNGTAGKSKEDIEKRLIELSPARMRPKHPPPFMIVQGKKDSVVPWEQAEKLAAGLRRAGGEVRILYNEDGDHLWPGIEQEIKQTVQWLYKKIRM